MSESPDQISATAPDLPDAVSERQPDGLVPAQAFSGADLGLELRSTDRSDHRLLGLREDRGKEWPFLEAPHGHEVVAMS